MRRRLLAALTALVLALTAAAAPTGTAAATVSAVTTLRILSVGDSITGPGSGHDSYRTELGRLLAAAGVTPTWVVAAVSGSRCTHWPSQIGGLLAQHDPDLVILACGTNDWAGSQADRDATGTAIRQVSEAIRLHRGETTPVRQIGAYVQLSDPYGIPSSLSWLPGNEEGVNRVLASTYALYLPYWTSLAVADLVPIPGNPVTLVDGIHPTAHGYRLMARRFYDAGAGRGWWAATSEPAPCELYGHNLFTPVPAYMPC